MTLSALRSANRPREAAQIYPREAHLISAPSRGLDVRTCSDEPGVTSVLNHGFGSKEQPFPPTWARESVIRSPPAARCSGLLHKGHVDDRYCDHEQRYPAATARAQSTAFRTTFCAAIWTSTGFACGEDEEATPCDTR